MIFDFSLLSLRNLYQVGASFATTFLLLNLLTHTPWPLLKTNKDNSFRKIRLGGIILILTVVIFSAWLLAASKLWLGLTLSAIVIFLAGTIDEQYSLRPATQLFWQLTAVILAVSFGWSIRFVSNPWSDGVIRLDQIYLGPYLLPGSLFAIVWLLLIMNAVNWLDGIDGLATGVGVVALITLALISLLPAVHDYQTLSLSLIGAGAVLAFFLWNFPPARIFLGTSGSWFLGLYIGLVALASGGKIATTLLVLAWPVVDLLFVSASRILSGHPPWQGDKVRHLHYRLKANGLPDWLISTLAIILSAQLGVMAVVLQTQHKVFALLIAAAVIIALSVRLLWQQKA